MVKEFWNERFSAEEYIYGEEPSAYFRQVIDAMNPGLVLVPGAGEGRDAVYAAKLGWKVHALDQSVAGMHKAFKLAEKHKVKIYYSLADAAHFNPGSDKFDLIAMVFFHLPPNLRSGFHSRLSDWLRPGGKVLIEAFHTGQLRNSSGGPKDPELLITARQLAEDFNAFEILENQEMVVELNEGTHHRGKADVVRFLGRKIF